MFLDPTGKNFFEDIADFAMVAINSIFEFVMGVLTLDLARLITASFLLWEVVLAPYNLAINGTLPKYQSYRGMGYVRNSMLAQTDAFSLVLVQLPL